VENIDRLRFPPENLTTRRLLALKMEERAAKRIGSQAAHLRRRVASKSKSLDLFDRPPRSKTTIGLPRHRSMAAMPMMASIPEDSSYRDWVGDEEPVAYRSPVSLDNGYRPTEGSRHHQTRTSSTLKLQCGASGNTCDSDSPAGLRECGAPGPREGGAPAGLREGGAPAGPREGGTLGPREGGALGGGETLHPRLTRQCSLQSPLDEGGEDEAALRLVGKREDGLPSVLVVVGGGRQEGKRRKDTTKKRERVSSSSLPPVWQLVPVTCLYLLLLLLLHLLSPILTTLPSLPTSPPTCGGLYNQSITRHSSL